MEPILPSAVMKGYHLKSETLYEYQGKYYANPAGEMFFTREERERYLDLAHGCRLLREIPPGFIEVEPSKSEGKKRLAYFMDEKGIYGLGMINRHGVADEESSIILRPDKVKQYDFICWTHDPNINLALQMIPMLVSSDSIRQAWSPFANHRYNPMEKHPFRKCIELWLIKDFHSTLRSYYCTGERYNAMSAGERRRLECGLVARAFKQFNGMYRKVIESCSPEDIKAVRKFPMDYRREVWGEIAADGYRLSQLIMSYPYAAYAIAADAKDTGFGYLGPNRREIDSEMRHYRSQQARIAVRDGRPLKEVVGILDLSMDYRKISIKAASMVYETPHLFFDRLPQDLRRKVLAYLPKQRFPQLFWIEELKGIISETRLPGQVEEPYVQYMPEEYLLWWAKYTNQIYADVYAALPKKRVKQVMRAVMRGEEVAHVVEDRADDRPKYRRATEQAGLVARKIRDWQRCSYDEANLDHAAVIRHFDPQMSLKTAIEEEGAWHHRLEAIHAVRREQQRREAEERHRLLEAERAAARAARIAAGEPADLDEDAAPRAFPVWHHELTEEQRTAPWPAQWLPNAEVTNGENALSVIFLTDAPSLINEGDEMHNCVGGYINSVLSGRCQIYSVLANSKKVATLEIRPNEYRPGHYRNAQLYGPCNQRVDAEISEFVSLWIQSDGVIEVEKKEATANG